MRPLLRAAAVPPVVALAGACSLFASWNDYSRQWGAPGAAGAGAQVAPDGSAGGGGGIPTDAAGDKSAWPEAPADGPATDAPASDAPPADAPAECPAGKTACDGECVDTASSALHCGGCGTSCEAAIGPLGKCSGGACVCPSGATKCGSACAFTSADPLHCGGCGNAVGSEFWCVGGQPVCRPGTSPCSGWWTETSPKYWVPCDYKKCTDKTGDGSHCWNSATKTLWRCYLDAVSTGRCIGGVCTKDSCPADRIECASTLSNVKSCFDPKRDSNHCGGCFKACKPNELCAQGACVAYLAVPGCSDCPKAWTCCPMPSWPNATVCVAGTTCPIPL